MKKFKLAFLFVTALVVFACKPVNKDGSSDDNESTKTTDKCDDITINDFDSFIGVNYDTPESKLKDILGTSSGGEYTADKASFKYYYKETKRVPVTVYVNAKTGDIETIFMEILGLQENFDQDVIKAKQDFNLDECQAKLFGKKPKDVISMWGAASKDNVEDNEVEEGVRTLIYYSGDNKIALTMKFYPSQENKMSSLMVDWFHD